MDVVKFDAQQVVVKVVFQIIGIIRQVMIDFLFRFNCFLISFKVVG